MSNAPSVDVVEGFLYLDSSALVKLVLPEPETDALLNLLGEWDERASSALAAVEVIRAVYRASNSELARRRARRVVEGVHLVTIDEEVLEIAARLAPKNLRTLDAIHVASAQVLQPDLGALVAYDVRLLEAAQRNGLTVISPR